MNKAAALVEQGLAQVGYIEGANNANKYGAWYGMDNEPWCMIFVSYCAAQANISRDIIPKLAYVPYCLDFYQKRGHYHPAGSYQPRPGDLVFFGQASHIGIVEKAENGFLFSIEGNTSAGGNSSNGDGVYRRLRRLDHPWIMGYAAPEYGEEETMEIKMLEIKDMDKGGMITVSAVNIRGSNYIRLRDVEKLAALKIDNEGKTPTLRRLCRLA